MHNSGSQTQEATKGSNVMDPQSTARSFQSTPQSRVMTRVLRKHHRQSARTTLVAHKVGPLGLDANTGPSLSPGPGESIPENNKDDARFISMMEVAMLWAFPGLASLAQSVQSLHNQSGSPHYCQQKQKPAEIKQFKNIRSDVLAYNRGDENATGPNREDIHFDMRGDMGSEWNKKIFQYLLEYLKQAKDKWCLPEAPDSYSEDLIIDKFNRVKLYWKAAQWQVNLNDEVETWQEVKKRLITQQEDRLNQARQRERQSNMVIKTKKHSGALDTIIWEWLKDMIDCLEEDIMSSEESNVERDDEGMVEKIYRVKVMFWQRNIEKELGIINNTRLQDVNLYLQ
ncbi:hypothetical protein SERLADRAFT_418884 [Serpula lacrymans var. lacrymans S7.9]|uniref:Uncharacterized protein n=1 Tax=Serpula lacrymans var. lacrymans (strain S7.9) TaxID=578457 RepID=F8PEH9_SERL9|nr:uncharacterized protein SERLADRAFT_418884 [Serpula lacrymans var. lacrymans S7.9]EGO18430.1 hypothetical protein SERLADRAFT_418884 [Serpula lacrymans var. lacrymans S7.9]